ncbi:MAG: hypothetical protein V1922_00785, partial [bacterium]
YKNKLDSIDALSTKMRGNTTTQKVIPTQTNLSASEGGKITPQPTVTPVSVTTKEDLTIQQNALDNTDLSSISSGLDQNTLDATGFAP